MGGDDNEDLRKWPSPCCLLFKKKGLTLILGSLYLQVLITSLYTDLIKTLTGK